MGRTAVIRLLADENIVGLEGLPGDSVSVTTISGRQLTRDQLEGFDALWVRSVTQVDEALVGGSGLRFVGTATAGLEHINQTVLRDLGIAFAAAPGSNANAVVEYVLAALAELGEPWERLEQGAGLAIVGYGHVGQRLASVARAMGWALRIYDPWYAQQMSTPTGKHPGLAEFCSFDEVLQATVISLHTSLHRETPWPSYHLFDDAALGKLSSAQWLVNAARGAVVDNRALRDRLDGASPVNCVLDVWEAEPCFDAALLHRPGLRLATPHIAGYSWDAKLEATRMLYAAMVEQGLIDRPLATVGERAAEIQPLCEATAAAGGATLEIMRALLSQRYRIADDNQRFRTLADLPDTARAVGFDRLRKEYPQRRELRGSLLSREFSLESDDLRRLCKALGLSHAQGLPTASDVVPLM
jgi:erythronate-4-phosphate dehydrogenase